MTTTTQCNPASYQQKTLRWFAYMLDCFYGPPSTRRGLRARPPFAWSAPTFSRDGMASHDYDTHPHMLA